MSAFPMATRIVMYASHCHQLVPTVDSDMSVLDLRPPSDEQRFLGPAVDDCVRQHVQRLHRARLCQLGARVPHRPGNFAEPSRGRVQVAELCNHIALQSQESRSKAEELVAKAQASDGADKRKEVVRELLDVVRQNGVNAGAEPSGMQEGAPAGARADRPQTSKAS